MPALKIQARGAAGIRATVRSARAWLMASGPLALAWARSLHAAAGDRIAPWELTAVLAGSAAITVGGAIGWRWHRVASSLITAGAAAVLAGAALSVTNRPAMGLSLLLAAMTLTALAWRPAGPTGAIARELIDVRLSAVAALATWLVAIGTKPASGPWTQLAVGVAALIAIGRTARWMAGVLTGFPLRVWPSLIGAIVLGSAAAAAVGRTELAVSVLALVPAATLVLARVRGVEVIDSSWSGLVLDHPERLVIATFMVLCAGGALVLALPVCSASGVGIGLLDAAFTSVSAVCVTGLIVLDTPVDFSAFGQIMLLVLIQLGALGIMSLSTAALGLLGRRLSVRHEGAVSNLFSSEHRGDLFVAVKRTFAVMIGAEIAGALVLSVVFLGHGDSLGEAVWRGVFTAISAFCNAGFALQSDSLVGYQTSPAVLHCVAILIIMGGLSPAVIHAVPRLVRGHSLDLQSRIVLTATAVFLFGGFFGYLALEWNHSLAGLSVADRLHNAWFQSVTFRTAGFNSVDMTHMQAATLPLACLLMFVGGAPGGTAGGIKVTTAWVLLVVLISAMRGSDQAVIHNRRISQRTVYRAIAILVVGAAVGGAVAVGMFLTQTMPGEVAVFETVSALGTVGVSTGGTAHLDEVGKVLIMSAMFLGRVGPLTVFLLLSQRSLAVDTDLLEDNVEVG